MQTRINQLGSLAVQELNAGNLQAAKQNLLEILKINPNEFNALKLLSHLLLQEKNLFDAIKLLKSAHAINPHDAEIIFNLGKASLDTKNYHQAIEQFKNYMQLLGPTAELLVDIGVAHYQLNQPYEATECYTRALNLDNKYLPALNNLTTIKIIQKDFETALEIVNKTLNISKNDLFALTNKGVILSNLQKYDEAVEILRNVVSISPNFIEAKVNLANCLMFQRSFSDALFLYMDVAKREPDNIENWINLGSAFNKLGEYAKALDAFDTGAKINPDYEFLLGQQLQMKSFLCNWDKNYYALKEKLLSSSNYLLAEPFHHLYSHDEIKTQLLASKAFANTLVPEKNISSELKSAKKDKLIIGYFSADFRDHPVAYLSAELFELHDKERFEIIAFSYQNSKSKMTERLKKSFNKFIDVSNLNDYEIAKCAREYGVDIAVDLGGYTQDARPRVFSYRVAPIQIGYLGYLGTSGAKWMDYLITDPTIINKDLRSYYAEKIICLPCYQVNDSRRISPLNQSTKSSLGIPKETFVFCCLNHCYKINPETFSMWMRILKSVPKSILYLYIDNQDTAVNLKHEAQTLGIEPARLIFGERASYDDYLSKYKLFDLFLDTRPYNAGTTASDALWMGIPVLTFPGESFASRYGASLLSSLEMPELIVSSEQEYENTAIKIAENPDLLKKIKAKLLKNIKTSRLFNTREFTMQLELAYLKIHEISLLGKPPEDILIE